MVRAAFSLKVMCLTVAWSPFTVKMERGDGVRLREGVCTCMHTRLWENVVYSQPGHRATTVLALPDAANGGHPDLRPTTEPSFKLCLSLTDGICPIFKKMIGAKHLNFLEIFTQSSVSKNRIMLKPSGEKLTNSYLFCSSGSVLHEIVTPKAMLRGTKMGEFCSPWKTVCFSNGQCPWIHRQVYAWGIVLVRVALL